MRSALTLRRQKLSMMKFSIVTPSYNSSAYIHEAIQSVVSQSGNFTIEYFIVDNCSRDNTRAIVEKFQNSIESGSYPLGCQGVELYFVSEQDQGMYDAINKGFAKASGDIFAWLNADDIYLPGAFATMAKVFATYKNVHWVKGITSYISSDSSIWQTGKHFLYTQKWIKAGIYGRDLHFIQQDSVFWRAWLWQKSGGINKNFKRAGDYYLWTKFAEQASLVTIGSCVSCFRSVEGQLSRDFAAYMNEVENYLAGKDLLAKKVRLYSKLEKRLFSAIQPCIFRMLFGRPEFAAVSVTAEGSLKKTEGEYYDVMKKL